MDILAILVEWGLYLPGGIVVTLGLVFCALGQVYGNTQIQSIAADSGTAIRKKDIFR
jgi:hypothetical protein